MKHFTNERVNRRQIILCVGVDNTRITLLLCENSHFINTALRFNYQSDCCFSHTHSHTHTFGNAGCANFCSFALIFPGLPPLMAFWLKAIPCRTFLSSFVAFQKRAKVWTGDHEMSNVWSKHVHQSTNPRDRVGQRILKVALMWEHKLIHGGQFDRDSTTLDSAVR